MMSRYIEITIVFRSDRDEYEQVTRLINPCIYTSTADFYYVLMTFKESLVNKSCYCPVDFFFNHNPYKFYNHAQLWEEAKKEALK